MDLISLPMGCRCRWCRSGSGTPRSGRRPRSTHKRFEARAARQPCGGMSFSVGESGIAEKENSSDDSSSAAKNGARAVPGRTRLDCLARGNPLVVMELTPSSEYELFQSHSHRCIPGCCRKCEY